MKFPAFTPINFKNRIEAFDIVELELTHIIPDLNQPRKIFNENSLQDLASSIKQHGVIQPIIVKKINDNQYQIIAGERRWRASAMAGLSMIPAIIQNNHHQKNIAISLIENIQREELNPIELAETFYQLHHEHGLSHEAIATMVGKNRTTVSNLLRLLNLSKDVRDLVSNNKLEMGHARALLTLPFDHQTTLAQKIMEKKLTVRDAEKMVQLYKLPRREEKKYYIEEVEKWISKLSEVLASKVAVVINEKGAGRMVIHFDSPDEVDWIVERLVEE